MSADHLGIAGMGLAGAMMLRAAMDAQDVHPVAVADPSVRLPGAMASIRQYADIGSLCRDDSIDTVYIATPTPLHRDHAVLAIRHGKDVIVEKPLAVNLREAEEIVSLAEAGGRVLVVGHSQSFEPAVRYIRKVQTDRGLGPAVGAQWAETSDWMNRPRLPAEFDETRGGGPVFRQASHQADVLRFVLGGEPTEVSAAGIREGPADCVGAYMARIRFDSGATAHLSYNGYLPFARQQARANGLSPEHGKRLNSERIIRRLMGPAAETGTHHGPRRLPSAEPASGGSSRFSLTVLYEQGIITWDGRDLLAVTDGQAEHLGTGLFPSGRAAVLAELHAAREGRGNLHDGTWGLRNLRTCLALRDSIRKRSSERVTPV